MSCGVGRRRGSDLALLWLWCRPVAAALIRPLAWEPPYATRVALEKAKTHTHKKKILQRNKFCCQICWSTITSQVKWTWRKSQTGPVFWTREERWPWRSMLFAHWNPQLPNLSPLWTVTTLSSTAQLFFSNGMWAIKIRCTSWKHIYLKIAAQNRTPLQSQKGTLSRDTCYRGRPSSPSHWVLTAVSTALWSHCLVARSEVPLPAARRSQWHQQELVWGELRIHPATTRWLKEKSAWQQTQSIMALLLRLLLSGPDPSPGWAPLKKLYQPDHLLIYGNEGRS